MTSFTLPDCVRAILLILLAVCAQSGFSKPLPHPQNAPAASTTAQELILRLHPRNPLAEQTELPPEILQAITEETGLILQGLGRTPTGEFRLRPSANASSAELSDTANALRALDDVLWVSVMNVSTQGASLARSMAADSPISTQEIREFRVIFHDSARQTGLSHENMDTLGLTALVQENIAHNIEFVRPMSGRAWVFAFSPPLSAHEAEAAMNRLRTLPEIQSAHLSPSIRTQHIHPNDPLFQISQGYGQLNLLAPGTSGPWGEPLIGIDAVSAWSITTGSAGVRVAIVDTGVLPEHPDLRGRILPGWNFVEGDANTTDPGDYCDTDTPPRHSSWHGTHLAGTIAANTNDGTGAAGIDWHARILPVRVLGQCGGYVSNVIDGLRWAAGLPVPGAPTNLYPAHIINLSLGSSAPCDAHWQSAINDVLAAGALIVVAAGNSSGPIDHYSPASCDGVITVTASDPHGEAASYSNYGLFKQPALSAPGGDFLRINDPRAGIIAASNLGMREATTHGWGSMSGTSMAAPHVAGTASLMLAENPALSPAQLYSLITHNDHLTPFPGWPQQFHRGRGILNAGKAVQAARASLPPEGPMLLRDAVYFYNLPLSPHEDKTLTGAGCDIFKLTLDVNSGDTAIAMGDAETLPTALAAQTQYPDLISEHGRMFAYSRYGAQPVKTFSLRANGASSSVTAFGYCFSRNPLARAYLHEAASCENTYSDGRKLSCQIPDNGTRNTPTEMSLRDALYLYDEEIPHGKKLRIEGSKCDVLHLLLDVEKGATTLWMHEHGQSAHYPDNILETGDMFAYALYADSPIKGFSLGNADTSPASSTTVTAFAYCYSQHSDARVATRR